jgi:DNA-binding transcriptional LysR family regulator
MERQVNAALNAVRAAKTGAEGVVRVSCVPGLVRLLLPLPVLVNDRHPRLTVEVSSVFRQVNLARGEADIALRMVKPSEPDLIARQAFEIGVAVYASQHYIERYGKPATKEELRKHRVVLYSEAFAHVAHFNWIEKYANPELQITRADGPDMACSLIAAGGGIGLADCHRGDREPGLVRVFPDVTSLVPGWLVYHESQRDTPRIKIVATMLEHFLREHRDLLRGVLTGPRGL